MASVYNRGTRAVPKWYAQVKQADGEWKCIRVHATTKPEARDEAEKMQARIDEGKPPVARAEAAATCATLMVTWRESLTNRSATDDEYRIDKHLIPSFTDQVPAEIRHSDVVRWLDKLKDSDPPLAGGTQLKLLGLLSRFFGWAIARGYCDVNPVRQLPRGERPRQKPKGQDDPWIKDDAIVMKIAAALPSPFGLMYLAGNRCGMRPGEVSGLRLSDLVELAEGRVRVRFSEDGPLKEDSGNGKAAKVKWAPAPPDVQQLLTSWLAQREADGGAPEDFLFLRAGNRRGRPTADGYVTKTQRSRAWRGLPEGLRGGMTWYEASRHSFASRNLDAGVPLEEVSGALGHAAPATTLRYYSRFVRKTYSDAIRRGLKLVPEESAKVLPFAQAGSSGK